PLDLAAVTPVPANEAVHRRLDVVVRDLDLLAPRLLHLKPVVDEPRKNLALYLIELGARRGHALGLTLVERHRLLELGPHDDLVVHDRHHAIDDDLAVMRLGGLAG